MAAAVMILARALTASRKSQTRPLGQLALVTSVSTQGTRFQLYHRGLEDSKGFLHLGFVEMTPSTTS